MSEYNAEDIISHSMKDPKVIEFTKYFETQITESVGRFESQELHDVEISKLFWNWFFQYRNVEIEKEDLALKAFAAGYYAAQQSVQRTAATPRRLRSKSKAGKASKAAAR